MPGYDEHVGAAKMVAMLVAPLITGLTYVLTEDPWLAAVGLCGSGLVVLGGMAPDLDSNSSIPRRRLVGAVSSLLVLVIGVFVGRYWELLVAVVEGSASDRLPTVPPELLVVLLVAAAVTIVLAKTDDGLQALIPAHRGLLHELAFWVGVGAACGSGLYVLGPVVGLSPTATLYSAIVLPALFLFGVSVHLVQDGEIV
ncbi:metal-dependent hydrolase [Halodesulfurarchaeum sp. HSR-GB]|uniref:metal-dependent hydrolase n=1 Tax=Halodesulfurarchaeum sp. HSR-GB TaxID=3074077 RepID=UPI002855E4D6|nr:metal-dependent hydrolase [Halodesulfurarchaeum sp. HSR-GB]MDR5655800.1 metal-dependent hydrolase [Halodesulfurarchaeum sp. HSR-GB]